MLLIIIEYNFDINENNKINDYFEFSYTLNMNKYIINNSKDDNSNICILISVIIHSGYSNVGHYYNFIKDVESNLWFEYNVIKVNLINHMDLEKEAYERRDNCQNEKNSNAYLLIYEKEDKSNCDFF